VFLTVLCLLFFQAASAAQDWRWSLEDIDLSGYGASITTDQDGNLHVSYYVPSGGQLKYGFRPAGTLKWYKMVLDSGLVTMNTSIAVDSAGNPEICYTPAGVKYARWNGRAWINQEVDPGGGLVGYTCSIKVDPNGRSSMAWYLIGKALRYAQLQDGVWLAQSVDGGDSEPGKWNSMALDPLGFPHVSYSDFPLGQLKYGWYDGKNWHVNFVDSPDSRRPGVRGMGNSLVLDSKGNPMISYYDEESLKLARFIDGKWLTETVESLPPFGNKWSWVNFRSTLLLDKQGFPHIGFESLLGLEHAWWDGHKWHSQLLVPTVGPPHFENSMTIDQNDVLYIVFRDQSDGTLRLASGRPDVDSNSAQKQKSDTPN
jgi:hypothetical protein